MIQHPDGGCSHQICVIPLASRESPPLHQSFSVQKSVELEKLSGRAGKSWGRGQKGLGRSLRKVEGFPQQGAVTTS